MHLLFEVSGLDRLWKVSKWKGASIACNELSDFHWTHMLWRNVWGCTELWLCKRLLWKNFNPSGIPGSCWELKIQASKFLAMVSALGWVVADNLQSIPKLLSLDCDLRRLCVETLVSPGCVPVSGWKKGKPHKSRRVNNSFLLMHALAVCQGV